MSKFEVGDKVTVHPFSRPEDVSEKVKLWVSPVISGTVISVDAERYGVPLYRIAVGISGKTSQWVLEPNVKRATGVKL